MGTLEDAIHEASIKQKPLLVYIHDLENEKEVSSKFFKNTLGNKEAATMLVSGYIIVECLLCSLRC